MGVIWKEKKNERRFDCTKFLIQSNNKTYRFKKKYKLKDENFKRETMDPVKHVIKEKEI